MALRTAARLACLCTRKPAASVPLLARGLASVQPGVGVLGQLAQRPVLGQAAAPAGWAAARRPAGLLLLRTTHSAPEQGAKKRDADELIKGYLLKASAVVAGNTRRIIGEQATGQACTEIEHHTVDGFTQVKIVFPVQGNMGSGRAFVKAEKDEEGTVLKSIKVIENRTGRPYRVYVRPRPPRVIDADYQDVPS